MSDCKTQATFGSFNRSINNNKVGRPRNFDLFKPFPIVSDINHLDFQGKYSRSNNFTDTQICLENENEAR